MPVTPSWGDEQWTSIHQVHVGEWTWAEWDACNAEMQAMMDSVDHRVDTIVNLLETNWLPDGGFSTRLSDLGKMPSVSHPNSGLDFRLS
jgi:hypothetical protein